MESFSSSSLSRPIHAYLSFKGDDETCKFTYMLWAALETDDLNTFCDDKKLEDPGDAISFPRHFIKAIKQSNISIVVFSKNYASSTWCLEELSQIAARIHEPQYLVIPIFYDVDPSEAQDQSNYFQQAFHEHEQRFTTNLRKVHSWRLAMKQVVNLSGWHVPSHPCPQVIIDDIVKEVKKKVRKLKYVEADLVGMQSRVKQVQDLLDLGSKYKKVRVVGICGMGGIGKSTLARVVYDRISHHFDSSHFLLKVSEFYDLTSQTLLNNSLVVIDDPDLRLSLKRMTRIVKHDGLGLGSRIIITTRDEGVIKMFEKHHIYKVKLLSTDEARQLFCWKAFRCDFPLEGYDEELINRALQYANGLPLAIVKLGSFLFNTRASQWSTALVDFKKVARTSVMRVLETSFYELDLIDRESFLDIACFFVGKEAKYVQGILDCHVYPRTRWSQFKPLRHEKGDVNLLIEKSLVTIIDQKIHMHSLLQEMGREIVRDRSPSKPEEWSRLWDFNDIYGVMENHKGADRVEAIVLELEDDSKESALRVEALSYMSDLRLLIFRNVKFYGVLHHLWHSVQHISWHRYPFTSLPSTFVPYNLKELILPDSCITSIWNGEKFTPEELNRWIAYKRSTNIAKCPLEELNSWLAYWGGAAKAKFIPEELDRWFAYKRSTNIAKRTPEEPDSWIAYWGGAAKAKEFPCLRNLNLSGSKNLTNLPNFKDFPRIERLDLQRCVQLSHLHPSIASLSRLKFLNLKNCSDLVSIPNDLFSLPSLEMLNLACCSKFAHFLKFRPFEVFREREGIQQSFPYCKRQKLCRQNSI